MRHLLGTFCCLIGIIIETLGKDYVSTIIVGIILAGIGFYLIFSKEKPHAKKLVRCPHWKGCRKVNEYGKNFLKRELNCFHQKSHKFEKIPCTLGACYKCC